MKLWLFKVPVTIIGFIFSLSLFSQQVASGWKYTEGAPGGGRYSSLTDINKVNVQQLKVKWIYRHGDYKSGGIFPDKAFKSTAFECTPIVVEDKLIFTTPYNRVIALNPETGAELWKYDPRIKKNRRFANMLVNRGVAYWKDTAAHSNCQSRVFMGTLDARLIAIDVATGYPIKEFGDNGTVHLLDGIEHLTDPREYNITSPPTVVGDIIIVGSSLADIVRRIQPSGVVRAYDARSGKLLWRFNTIPKAGEAGNETWENESWKITGGANVWSTITADLERGLVFLPVSTAGPDLYGGDRPGANLFSDALVALDARTGKRVWHFQTVHHDIWDYDLAAPPVLVTVDHNGSKIDAIAQATKTGFIFLLHRDTGEPLFPVEERVVPVSDVPGEKSWPTQPFPLRPEPLMKQTIDETDIWAFDSIHYKKCIRKLRSLRNEGLFTPPSERGSILYPGAGGGANWSGAAYDPVTAILYVPVNSHAMIHRLKKLPFANFHRTKARVMRTNLAAAWWVVTGKGTGLRYSMIDRKSFEVNGIPCKCPPWNWMTAMNLNTGKIAWQIPTGEDSNKKIKGSSGFCPPLFTASGLLFHSGTRDQYLYVYNADNGSILTKFKLPAGLHAGPVTFKLRPEGKQYLVVAAGGHSRVGSKLGDYIIAYTSPDSE
jgi:quinoprotein glucose dehydrogenase